MPVLQSLNPVGATHGEQESASYDNIAVCSVIDLPESD